MQGSTVQVSSGSHGNVSTLPAPVGRGRSSEVTRCWALWMVREGGGGREEGLCLHTDRTRTAQAKTGAAKLRGVLPEHSIFREWKEDRPPDGGSV